MKLFVHMAEGKQGKGLQKNENLLLSYFSIFWFAISFLHLKMWW